MRKFKKCLTFLLVLSMIVTTVPLDVFATQVESVQEIEAQEGECTDDEIFGEETDENVDEVFEEEKSEDIVEDTYEGEKTEDNFKEEKRDEIVDENFEENVSETSEEISDEKDDEEQLVLQQMEVSSVNMFFSNSSVMEISEGTETGVAQRILHLDCGRKYFTKDWIIALINEMSYAQFNQLQLAFGNDGLRFLLDDMSVEIGTSTYSDESVKEGIRVGNKNYYDAGEKNELTQAEMTEIVAYAKSKGIEIVPHMNMPGHMDAILDAIEYVGISDAHFIGYDESERSLNLNNTQAVNFTHKLLEKYVAYFKSLGCQYFHIGADEYANDAYSGNMGFPSMGSALYTKFANFVNGAAGIVEAAGMIPRAWNDGISYGNYSAEFDTDIEITYWSSGWWGYDVASPNKLASNGHKMINTNGEFYYIVRNEADNFDKNGGYAWCENFSNDAFVGGDENNPISPIGSMFCIWADEPGAETETEVAANIRLLIRAMGLRMQNKSIDDIDTTTVVKGGFKVDGTISAEGVSINRVTDEKSETDVYATGPNFTHVEAVTLSENEVTTIIENINVTDIANVRAWDVTPYVDTEAYNKGATVELPVPTNWNTANMGAFVVNDDNSITLIEGKYSNGYYKFEMPHFSVAGIYDVVVTAEITDIVDVELTIGETKTFTDETGTYENAETNVAPDTAIATMLVTDVTASANKELREVKAIESGKSYVIAFEGNGYHQHTGMVLTDKKTEPADTRVLYALGLGAKVSKDSTELWTISGTSDDGIYTVKYAGTEKYLNLGQITNGNGSWANVVGDAQLLKIAYENGTWTICDASGAYLNNYANTGSAAGWNGDGRYDARNDNGSQWKIYEIFGETTDSTEIAFRGESIGTTVAVVGHTQYNITVTEVPLKIEYWITNSKVNESESNSSTEKIVKTTDEGINTAKGVEVSKLVPEEGYRGRKVEFWRARFLNGTTERQTIGNGVDETYGGEEFTKIRYWENKWQVYTTEWKAVDVTSNQLVAYYMEFMQIADEISVRAADWGKPGDGSTANDYLPVNAYCSMSIQLIYEDGTMNPQSTNADDLKSKTIVFGYSKDRGIGTFIFKRLADYQVYKVTAETGSVMAEFFGGDWGSVEVKSFEWDNNAVTIWEDDPIDTAVISHRTQNISAEALENLSWDENQEAILLRVYVKAIAKEDNLRVHYVDDTFDSDFYVQDIPVKEGVLFDSDLQMEYGKQNSLINNEVVNFYGNTQYVNADLKGMSEIGAQYKYSNYYLVNVNFGMNDNGTTNYKDVYLHYTFSPVRYFIADFGLPLEITPENLDSNLNATNVSNIEISSEKTRFGTINVDVNTDNTKRIIYTPIKVLAGVDAFTVLVHTTSAESIQGGGNGQVAFRVYIVPATTVHYEEGFVSTWTGTWDSKGSKGSGKQELQLAGAAGLNYGYTNEYDNVGASSGTQAISKIGGEKAEFTFTGTGVEIYANCDPATSIVVIMVYNADTNKLEKFYQINTKTKSGDKEATAGQNSTQYGLPIAAIMDLNYGNYKVVVQHTKSANDFEKEIRLDGFKVYNTLTSEQQYIVDGTTQSAIYAADEQGPLFIEVRDEVLTAANIISTDGTNRAASEIIEQVFNSSSNLGGALLLASGETVDAEDLLKNGPKNELFLHAGDAVTFNLGSANAQIGMKAINGGTSYTITHTAANAAGMSEKTGNVVSSIDMFYEEGVKGTVTIRNTGSSILSITKLKVLGAAVQNGSFELEPITEEQVMFALNCMAKTEAPEDDTKPEGVTKPEDNVKPEGSTKPEETTKPETGSSSNDNLKQEENTKQESSTTNIDVVKVEVADSKESSKVVQKENNSAPSVETETTESEEAEGAETTVEEVESETGIQETENSETVKSEASDNNPIVMIVSAVVILATAVIALIFGFKKKRNN